MNQNQSRKTLSLMAAASLSFAAGTHAAVIDDFDTVGLENYTLTRVLDNGVAESNVSFSDASGSLVASYGGTVAQAEQVLLLRSDFSLSIGDTLSVDVSFAAQTSQMDFGLAIASTATPASASVGDTDVRDTFNWAAVYLRPGQDAVRNTSSINGTVNTGAGVVTAVETSVSTLFIERISSTDFTVGYVDTGAVRHDTRTISFTATDVGTAIGFYGDLRAVGGSLGSLDNLSITPVPEPASGALLLLGGGALAMLAKRRRSV